MLQFPSRKRTGGKGDGHLAVELVGRMLHDVRRIRTERNQLRRELDELRAAAVPGVREAVASRFPWTRRLLIRTPPA